MKLVLVSLLFFCHAHLSAQVIRFSDNPNNGSIIWFTSFTVKNGTTVTPVDNYQAAILKNGIGEKYLLVINSSDWLKGTKSRPSQLAIYETPGYAMHVVLDFDNYKFKFYPWNAKDFAGPAHHSDTQLNFIGNDHKPHSISFADFVGR
ncbi:MAG: hypothetical protein JST58_12505 [Bacteroidetes bacterium]|nr:hypothetical protein [Bacteroidota bacterium]